MKQCTLGLLISPDPGILAATVCSAKHSQRLTVAHARRWAKPARWYHAFAVSDAGMRNATLDERRVERPRREVAPDAGWHLSYFMSLADIARKARRPCVYGGLALYVVDCDGCRNTPLCLLATMTCKQGQALMLCHLAVWFDWCKPASCRARSHPC